MGRLAGLRKTLNVKRGRCHGAAKESSDYL